MDLDCSVRKKNAGFWDEIYRRLLNISYKDHVTNEEVRRKIQATVGEYDELLTLVRQNKRWEDNIKELTGMGGLSQLN